MAPVVLAEPVLATNGVHVAPEAEGTDGFGQDAMDRDAMPDAPSGVLAVMLPEFGQHEEEDLREEVAVGGLPAQAGPDD